MTSTTNIREEAMPRIDLLNRVITAAALITLAVTLGVWLTRCPLTAAPAATPVKNVPEPTLAPPRVSIPPEVSPAIIEVPVEVEIAAAAEPKTESQSAYPPHRSRGLFRRR